MKPQVCTAAQNLEGLKFHTARQKPNGQKLCSNCHLARPSSGARKNPRKLQTDVGIVFNSLERDVGTNIYKNLREKEQTAAADLTYS